MRTKTEQELFWEGTFGEEYSARNRIAAANRAAFFAHVLSKTYGVLSVCEFGANIGTNLQAIRSLSENFLLTGVELNAKAFEELKSIKSVDAICLPIQDFQPNKTFDLVFTCGVLIHLNPDDLPIAYRKMYDTSARYVLINEYFNPTPVELTYRGHSGRLFKRDFALEFKTLFENKVRLIEYGFLWQADNPAWDNTTWFLFEKCDA
ncbi:MAG TPA: pseudaminic acid biosynthesis-associated methylase [Oculatellaceae cyanobacterium]